MRGVPGANDLGPILLKIIITDSAGSVEIEEFKLLVNQKPEVANALQPEITRTGKEYIFVVPENTFVDPDNDPLTYSIKFLGPWATFDPETREIKGTPGDLDLGVEDINVIASDPTCGSATSIKVLTIEKNYLPKV